MNSYERVSSLYMKTLFYIIISTLFLFNFSKVKNKNVENLKVSQAKEIKADTLFSKIEFIPLNISNIDSWKTKKSKRYIYIYSLGNLSINIFSVEGKYITTLDYMSNSNISYPVDILVKEEIKEIWILEKDGIIHRFSENGKTYKGKINLNKNSVAIHFIDKQNYLSYDGNFNSKDKKYITCANLLLPNSEKQYIAKTHHKINCNIPASLFACLTNKKDCYIKIPYFDTIYKSSEPGKISAHFYLDFEGKSLNLTNYPKDGFTDKTFSELIKSKQYVYDFNSFHRCNNYLFFKTKGYYDSFFMINLNNKRLYRFNFLFDNYHINNYINPIQGSYKNQLLLLCSAQKIKQYYSQNNQKTNFPKFAEQIKNLDQNIESILLICTLK